MMDVLCCKITIGDANPSNPMEIKDAIEITEVQSIEINETYKKLIGTAKITLPKGSVCRSTIIGTVTTEGKDASIFTTEIMEDGVIIEKQTTQRLVDTTTFKVGQRVNIKLGYNGVLKNMFDGYITGYNSESNLEIECENMAYKLKLKKAPHFETPASGTTVNDVLEGEYNILKDTGFKIHSDTKKFDIHIGKIKVTDNFTVADILSEWSKYKVYCFLKYDANNESAMPSIAVGRPYSSSKAQPVFPEDESTGPFKIYFNEHVAQSSLKVVKTDPKFLAVTGKAMGTDEKFFEVTIRLNPEYVAQYHANGDDLYQTIIDIIHQLPLSGIFLVVLALAMFAFYATSFDSITMVASNYSYKNIDSDETASKKMKLFWAILLIMLPIALIFSEGTMANLQTVSIIAAFPIGIVMILIIASFIKDAKKYISDGTAEEK